MAQAQCRTLADKLSIHGAIIPAEPTTTTITPPPSLPPNYNPNSNPNHDSTPARICTPASLPNPHSSPSQLPPPLMPFMPPQQPISPKSQTGPPGCKPSRRQTQLPLAPPDTPRGGGADQKELTHFRRNNHHANHNPQSTIHNPQFTSTLPVTSPGGGDHHRASRPTETS